ncbi:uncharacterized protein LOC143888905 [Tasmannia lanceolata]|uniref:uncharacterized protein LOC143888905 n=1 Tax=Tasmannia lanceolata TaxID=3420 RepID=UPI0040635915
MAYDYSRRDVIRTLSIAIFMAGKTFDVEFQVLDIMSSFNLLLGQPWLHKVGAVPSSLHQKFKLMKGSRVITVRGDEDLEVGAILSDPHGKSEEGSVYLNGFHLDVTHISWEQAKKELVPLPHDINPIVSTMLKINGYIPGMRLGRYQQGVVQFDDLHFPSNVGTTCPGYRNTHQEEQDMYRSLTRRRLYTKAGEVMPMPDIKLTLNGHFCREGEDFPYYGFPEWSTHPITGERVPGFQIFFATGWPGEEDDVWWRKQYRSAETLKFDWTDYLEPVLMRLMFQEDSLLVCTIRKSAPMVFPQSMITNAGNSELSNWTDTFVPLLTIAIPLDSESESFSDFDLSSKPVSNVSKPEEDEETDETPLEIKNLIEQREQRRAKLLEDEFEIINIGTEPLLQEIKIGKTLSPEERAELIKLLKEFKEVFAWSYKDMPGLSEDIVQHHIPLYPEAKPKNQKLRNMRPEWLLKIKDDVTNQLKVGFLEIVTYPDWLTNIVPIPKKNGRMHCCVDFRDLTKANPKDDFPLPPIDILVDNTAGHALLSFMDVFSEYNQIKMAPEDKAKTTFTT